MAKVQKFTGNQDITVTPISKSMVWQYTGSGSSYTFRMNNNASEEGYDPNYSSFAVRSKNDIVVTTMFATKTGKVKKVTNTIKNYFANPEADYQVQYSHMTAAEVWLTVRPGTQAGNSGLFGTVADAEYYLASSAKKSDMITFTTEYGTEVLDLKGNDSYLTKHYSYVTDYFYELVGNDTYKTTSYGIMRVNDYSGKDKYEIHGSDSILNANDYKGNDDYSMVDCIGFVINDYAGNDVYRNVDNTDNAADRIINDFKGNDKYEVKDTSVVIEDKAGKDNYQIYNTKAVINDTGKGNDTYGIYDCFNMSYDSSNFNIEDEKGNETYNITGWTFIGNSGAKYAIKDLSGNDKYNFKDSESGKVNVNNVQIIDESGKDKYNLTVSDSTGMINNVRINDKAGADSYTFTGHEDSYIKYAYLYDRSKSKDKYNFNKVTNSYIYEYGGNDTYKFTDCRECTVHDYVGNDKYTVSQKSKDMIYIIDEGKENDSYTVDISKENTGIVGILDFGGKDSLTLSGLKKDNLVFMTNITYDGNIDGKIIAYNKENGGFVYVVRFYSRENGAITGFGDGRIETVKAGKTTLKDVQSEALYNDFNSLRETVANWLSESGKSEVFDVLQNGTDYQKDCLVALFTHSDLPPNPVT